MARLAASRSCALALSIALIATAALAGCNQSLPIRNDIVAAVEESTSGPRLALYEGTTAIPRNGSVAWPDTIFLDSSPKTFTIKNAGNENLVISNVAINGSANYFEISVQPASLTLAPGNTTDFKVKYEPNTADANSSVSLVINSNDAANPAFGFVGTGHSTQWHGVSTTPLLGAADDVHVVADASKLYWSYRYKTGDITILSSSDGGRHLGGVQALATGPSYSRMAVYAGALFEFLYDGTKVYTEWLTPSDWYEPPYWGSYTASIDGMSWCLEGDILVTGRRAYVVWCNYSAGPRYKLFGTLTGSEYKNFAIEATTVNCFDDSSEGGRFPSMATDGAVSHIYVLSATSDQSQLCLSVLEPDYWIDSAHRPTRYTVSTLDTGKTVTNCALVVVGSGNSAVLHALWTDSNYYKIWYSRASASDPSAWTTPVLFTDGDNFYGRNSHLLPFVADGSGNLIFLHAGQSGRLRISRSTDGGSTWSHAPVDTDDWDSGYVSSISLAAQGNTVYAVYTKRLASDRTYNYVLRKSLDGGLTW